MSTEQGQAKIVKEIPWVTTAEALLFTNEAPGTADNPRILRWAQDFGGWVASFYKKDSIPWCGLFVGHCMRINGIHVGIQNPLSALAWNKFGVKCDPMYGAVMVFSRSGGGHVGFYVSEDRDAFHILGGNQSDTVNVTRISKSRFVGARWPSGYEYFMTPGRIYRTFTGQLSVNEA